MNNRELDQMLGRLMKQDFSVGTDAFREDLLKRCKDVLNADDEGVLISDEDLDMLAAAGDVFSGLEGNQHLNS